MYAISSTYWPAGLALAVALWVGGCISPVASPPDVVGNRIIDELSSQPSSSPSPQPPSGSSSSDSPADSISGSSSGPPPPTPDNSRQLAGGGMRILIDASHDGGVWWYPQWEGPGGPGFSPYAPHQGYALAQYLRTHGFVVDELTRGVVITDEVLNPYTVVIRAGDFGAYTEGELQAYDRFLTGSVTLLLISDFHRGGEDPLARRVGLQLSGLVDGTLAQFADHPITQGITPFPYIAGSIVGNAASNPGIEVLGWLGTGEPVMGIIRHPTARIFFLGELNGIETAPEPFVDNLMIWAMDRGQSLSDAEKPRV